MVVRAEAYLGLIAFTIAYRRLTASDETDYEKDGGVTVFFKVHASFTYNSAERQTDASYCCNGTIA